MPSDLTSCTRTSRTILCRSAESRYPCLFLIFLTWENIWSHIIKCNDRYKFFYASHQLRNFLSIINLLRAFIIKKIYEFCCCYLVTELSLTLYDPMDYNTPDFPVLHHLPEFAQTHVHWVSDAIQPLSPPSPALNLSIRVFSNESALPIRWPKYWSFSFSISPSNEYSGLIFFRIDWLDLLAVQRTLKSLLWHHTLKVSILWCSAFFMVPLPNLYVTTGKTLFFTIWTLVGKVMFLLFNTLSRSVIAFLSRSKHFLISVSHHLISHYYFWTYVITSAFLSI